MGIRNTNNRIDVKMLPLLLLPADASNCKKELSAHIQFQSLFLSNIDQDGTSSTPTQPTPSRMRPQPPESNQSSPHSQQHHRNESTDSSYYSDAETSNGGTPSRGVHKRRSRNFTHSDSKLGLNDILSGDLKNPNLVRIEVSFCVC